MLSDLLTFLAIGFAAQLVDGAIGMAYGLTSTTILLSVGVPPAMASASVHAAEVFTTGASGISHWRLGNVDGALFRRLVAPRLSPPSELEAELPPRFAQAVGTAFGAVATLGYATGAVGLAQGAVALALAAAFLNAAFGFCLGCEVLLVARRVLGRAEITRFVPRNTITKGASA